MRCSLCVVPLFFLNFLMASIFSVTVLFGGILGADFVCLDGAAPVAIGTS